MQAGMHRVLFRGCVMLLCDVPVGMQECEHAVASAHLELCVTYLTSSSKAAC